MSDFIVFDSVFTGNNDLFKVCQECCGKEICNLALPIDNSRLKEMFIEIGFNSSSLLRATQGLIFLLTILLII